MPSSLSQLHFLEPLWLLALVPLALILWLFSRSRPNASAWAKVIDHNLLSYLLQGKESKVSKLPKGLLGIGGLIAVIALANPVWEKISRPVFQTNSARVIVLDLSNSMLINDLKPSRLARARFKIEDILSRDEEGQTGLVVFAGDAFTASPLTRDVDTIRNLLQVFTPQLMPAQGSRVDYGLKKAHELLQQAGVRNGQVLLIADGVSNPAAAIKAVETLKADGHSVSVLAVGTEKGGLLRLRTKRVNVKLDVDTLQKISKKGGGGYHVITANNTDLNTVLKTAVSNGKHSDKQNQTETDDFKSDDWKSNGPYLLLLLLPIAALVFRKGWLLNLFIAVGLSAVFIQPDVAYATDAGAVENIVDKESAIETAKEAPNFIDSVNAQWRKLWLNSEQRADRAFKQKQYKQASQLSEAPLRKGSASYKNNDYKAALNAFQKAQGADARYNQGNALAKMEKYEEAIESYKKALEVSPEMKDAKINKKAVEDFLKKKKQQENQKEGQKKGDKNKKQKGKKSDKKPGKKGESKDDAQENKEGDKQGDKEGNEKNQFAKANKDLEKKKNANKQKQVDEEQEAKEKASKAKKAGQDKNDAEKAQDENKAKAIKAAKEKAEELSKEEKMAAEQWLRRIPDDPGGLLRRKFRRQYQRNNRRPNDDEQPW